MMHWPKLCPQGSHQDAVTALDEVRERLEHAREDRKRSRHISEALDQRVQANHFREGVERSMPGGTP